MTRTCHGSRPVLRSACASSSTNHFFVEVAKNRFGITLKEGTECSDGTGEVPKGVSEIFVTLSKLIGLLIWEGEECLCPGSLGYVTRLTYYSTG